jgi:hypothetical protein
MSARYRRYAVRLGALAAWGALILAAVWR